MTGLTVVALVSMLAIFVFMTAESESTRSFDTWFSRILSCLSAGVCFVCVSIIVWKLAQ